MPIVLVNTNKLTRKRFKKRILPPVQFFPKLDFHFKPLKFEWCYPSILPP